MPSNTAALDNNLDLAALESLVLATLTDLLSDPTQSPRERRLAACAILRHCATRKNLADRPAAESRPAPASAVLPASPPTPPAARYTRNQREHASPVSPSATLDTTSTLATPRPPLLTHPRRAGPLSLPNLRAPPAQLQPA